MIKEHGEGKEALNHTQFYNFLEESWSHNSEKKQQDCAKRMKKNMEILETVFNFLDTNNNE